MKLRVEERDVVRKVCGVVLFNRDSTLIEEVQRCCEYMGFGAIGFWSMLCANGSIVFGWGAALLGVVLLCGNPRLGR